MDKRNLWRLSTVLVILVLFTVLTSTILLIPWEYFSKEKNSIEWLTLILSVGSLVWSFLLYQLFLFYQNKQIRNKLKYTNPFDFSHYEDTKKVTKLLDEHNINRSEVEYQIDGATDLEDDSIRTLSRSPEALSYQGKNIIVIPGFFLARFRQYPKAFASVLTHELAHFSHKDLAMIHKVQLFVKAVIIIFALSSLLFLSASIYADLQVDSNSLMLAIWASVIGKNYLLFQGLVIVLLLLIHKQLEIWREAQADAEAIKHFGEETIKKSEELLNTQETITRATTFHRDNLTTLTPIWVFIAGVVIALFSHRLAGTVSYLFQTSNQANLFDIADTFSNLLLFSGSFYILTTFFKNIAKKDGHFLNLIFMSAFLLILGNYTAFLLLETMPHMISSTMMPEGYDYILRYDPISSFIGSFQIIIVNATIMVLVVISLLVGYVQKRIWLAFLLGVGFIISLFFERQLYFHLLEGWLTPLIFSSVLILLYSYRREAFIPFERKSYLLASTLLLIGSLDYLGLTNINHFSKVQMERGNHYLLKEQDISKSIPYYRKALEISPYNLDTSIFLMKLLGHNNQIGEAIEIADQATVSVNYFEPFWNKRYEYYVAAGSLRLQRRTEEDLVESKNYFTQAEYMYRNNSRLESGQDISKMLFYNLACLEATMKNYQDASIYLLEFIMYFQDKSIFNDSDLVLLMNQIKNTKKLPHNRLRYLDELFKSIDYKYTFVETKKLLKNQKITFEDLLFILKLKSVS